MIASARLRRLLRGIAGASLALVVLLVADVRLALRITRGRLECPVEVLAVTWSCPASPNAAEQRLLDALASVCRLPSRGSSPCDQTSFETGRTVLASSPYPPYLAEYDPRYPRQPTYAAVLARRRDGDDVQLSIFRGEADSTPSLAVAAMRGGETGWGDHHPVYLFAHPPQLAGIPPVLAASWESEEIAGMEGARELLVVLVLLTGELAAVVLLACGYWLGRRFVARRAT